jgi:hypothetical protein
MLLRRRSSYVRFLHSVGLKVPFVRPETVYFPQRHSGNYDSDTISDPLRGSLTADEHPRGQPPLRSHRPLRFLLDDQTQIPDLFDFAYRCE